MIVTATRWYFSPLCEDISGTSLFLKYQLFKCIDKLVIDGFLQYLRCLEKEFRREISGFMLYILRSYHNITRIAMVFFFSSFQKHRLQRRKKWRLRNIESAISDYFSGDRYEKTHAYQIYFTGYNTAPKMYLISM